MSTKTFSWGMTTEPKKAPPDSASLDARRPRSIPWHTGEMIMVDGKRYCYSIDHVDTDKQNVVVRFPGGGSASIESLYRNGHKVIIPALLRTRTHM